MPTEARLIQWAQSVAQEWADEVAHAMGLPTGSVVIPTFIVDAKKAGPIAATVGPVTYLNPKYFAREDNDQGAIVHEMVHTTQNIAGGGDDTSAGPEEEHMADAVRYRTGVDQRTGREWQPDPEARQLAELKPWQLQAYNQVMMSEGYATDKGLQRYAEGIASGRVDRARFSADVSGSGVDGRAITGAGQFYTNVAPDSAVTSGGHGGPVGTGTPGTQPMPTSDPGPGSKWAVVNGVWTPVPAHTGGGDKKGLSHREIENNTATFNGLLDSYGINATGNISHLVDIAAQRGWNAARFQAELATTQEFHDRFPGIFDAEGDLKMSPAAYIKTEAAYESTATQNGVNLNAGKTGWLFKNDVSAAEFSTRAAAMGRLRSNNDMFSAFNQELKGQGKAPLSKKDLFKFVLGEGNKEWYDSWNDTLSRYYGQQAGLSVGPGHPNDSYTQIGAKAVDKIGAKGLSESELAQGYQALAQQLTTTMPLSKIQKFGLSKQDLIELQFGGSRQASVAQKVQQILKNEQNIEEGPKAALGGINPGGAQGISQKRAQV